MPLINCAVSLTLTWSENCVITSKTTGEGNLYASPSVVEISNSTSATFKITDTKLDVPVVTLSNQNDNKLLEQLETRFKRTVKWNKHRSEITSQTRNDSLNYLIDPIFSKVNRLFVSSFENEENRTAFSKYYTPTVEIKDYKVVIDGKSFFMFQ